MGEFELYDVPTICRDCGLEFTGKAFKPADEHQRYGFCEDCTSKSDARARARQNVSEPKPKVPELTPPRRIWEPE